MKKKFIQKNKASKTVITCGNIVKSVVYILFVTVNIGKVFANNDTNNQPQEDVVINTNDNIQSSVNIIQEDLPQTQAEIIASSDNVQEQTIEVQGDIIVQNNIESNNKLEESVKPQEQPSTSTLPKTTMMRSASPKKTANNQPSYSQQAQLKTISYINNNIDKVRYTNNKRLNANIQNTFKDNIVNDGKNIGNINDSMWYSINMDMSNNRDNLTKSSNGSTLINFGYNFNYIDNIDSSVAISFNQTKSDLKMYSKDIPVNTYDFALSLYNKYNFGNDIVLSGMLSYNHNIVKDRRTKNIKYDYIDEGANYIISDFTKPTHKKHYNDIALSLSALHNYNILDNVKLTSGITADYFTTHKVHNALIVSPTMEVSSINGFYHNILFPVVYVKYNVNTNNNKNINISDTKKVNLDKNNMEYGIKTKVGLTDKANISFTYSGDSNKNNSVGANVGVEF